LAKSKKKRVSFIATKKGIKNRRITFITKSGKKVSFIAKEKIPKKVRVTFYAKSK